MTSFQRGGIHHGGDQRVPEMQKGNSQQGNIQMPFLWQMADWNWKKESFICGNLSINSRHRSILCD